MCLIHITARLLKETIHEIISDMSKNLKHKLFDTVCASADAHTLIPQDSTIVVGFSGGPDSVFLLHFLNAMRAVRNLTLYAAHLNHEWRGAEADEDVAFCKAMAAELDIPFIAMRLSELSPQPAYEGSREARAGPHGVNF